MFSSKGRGGYGSGQNHYNQSLIPETLTFHLYDDILHLLTEIIEVISGLLVHEMIYQGLININQLRISKGCLYIFVQLCQRNTLNISENTNAMV